jgi:hypothetical protein
MTGHIYVKKIIDVCLNVELRENLTLSSGDRKVAFVLCKTGAQRNAQNKGRFLGQLQRFVMC